MSVLNGSKTLQKGQAPMYNDSNFLRSSDQHFSELDDPTFWGQIASQVDVTSLIYPDVQTPRYPSNPYLPGPRPTTEYLWLPSPSETAITPYRPNVEGESATTGQHTQTKKQSMLLPILLIGLAAIIILAVFSGNKFSNTDTQQPTLPAGMPDSPYVHVAWQDAQKAGIRPDYFVKQINQESGFNPKAYSQRSGAEGIAQFMPSTASGLSNPFGAGKFDPWNPEESLMAAALYMAAKVHAYDGDYAKALAAYNGGSGGVQTAIDEAIQTDGTPDTWRKYLPAETQRYISDIMD